MDQGPLAAIVLAAGKSKRMRSDTPKVLHQVLGQPLVEYVVQAARGAGASRIVVVVAPDQRQAIGAALAGYPEVALAVQDEPRGTGHAVLAARAALADFRGTGLILLGDAPCVTPGSLQELLRAHRERAAAVTVLSGKVQDPTGYGRVLRGPDGDLSAIVEEKDAGASIKGVSEINSGVFALELPRAFELLEKVTPSASTGELYVTQVVELARAHDLRTCAAAAAQPEDVLGVNDRVQLAQVTTLLRRRINRRHQENGVTIVDPETAFIDARAQLEPDVRIEPFVVVQGACRLERGAVVGPFAHLRGESRLGPEARVGNFVEVVRSELGAGTRALHLSFIGDASLGAGVNVGAGTVFANWDGARHHRSEVGEGASLGSDTVLVAPAQVGAGARTGAGAVVAKASVPAGETWVGVPARRLPAGEETSC